MRRTPEKFEGVEGGDDGLLSVNSWKAYSKHFYILYINMTNPTPTIFRFCLLIYMR